MPRPAPATTSGQPEKRGTSGPEPSAFSRPSRAGSLRVNVAYSLAAAGFQNLGRLAAILLLAKFADTETLGLYTYALAATTPVVLLLGFEVRAAFVADVRAQFSFGQYARLRRFGLWAAAIIVAVMSGLEFVRRGEIWPALIVGGAGAGRIAWGAAELAWGGWQRRERFELIALGCAIRGAAQAAIFAAALLLPATPGGSSAPAAPAYAPAALATWLCAAVWLATYQFFERRSGFAADAGAATDEPRGLARVAAHTLPLGMVQLLIALCDSVPRVWIAESQPEGLSRLGHFGALAYLALAVNIALVAVGTAASNRLAQTYCRDARAFLSLAGRLAALAVGAGALVMLATWLGGRWLLETLYRPDYAVHFPAFALLMAAQCITFLAAMFGFAVTSMRLFWIQAIIHATVLATTVASSAWLIPGSDPVLGAAWVAVARSAVHVALYAACVVYGVAVLGRAPSAST